MRIAWASPTAIVIAGTLAFGSLLLAGCGPSATPAPTAAPTARITAEPSPLPVATPQADIPPEPVGAVYTVRKGDTLWGIAKEFGVTLDALREANPEVTDPTRLRVGTVLTIP